MKKSLGNRKHTERPAAQTAAEPIDEDIVLRVRDLEVVYRTDNGDVRAVNGISFDVKERETIGLVGETGAGKTTTALAIMRLLPERTGRILNGQLIFRGEELQEKSAEEMRAVRGALISMIFQDPMTALNPLDTVGQQIRESLEIHNVDGRSSAELDARVDELLTLVGISPKRKNEYPHQFSGGMKQRIIIAIALACEPQLLIADEPTTALDVTIQAQVLALMEELKERLGTSVIMITHDLGIVAKTCDKVAVIYAGEVVETGTVQDIFQGERHHPYTTGLFGAIPNLDVDTDRLTPIEGLMPDPLDLPAGCKFSPRCKHAMPCCREEPPFLYERNGHFIRCSLLKGDA